MEHNEEENLKGTGNEEVGEEVSEEVVDEVTETVRAITEAKEEAATNLAGWQRSMADFENYKKREEAKQREIMDFAKEVTIVKLLPTLDTLEQGLRHAPAGVDENWLRGIEGTLQKLDKVLEEMGVKKIEAVGKRFDPHFHEAVREVPAEDGVDDGMVVEDLQTGFELNGKVIRPSQVVISKKE